MRIRARALLATLVAATSAATAAPSGAAILPVGAGVWGPSTNVSASSGCKGITTSTTDCVIAADSHQLTPLDVETCNNASYVITTPVIIGTNFGCNVFFTGSIRLTGAGAGQEVGNEQTEVEIEVGACAGVTLSDFYVDVTDNAVGTFRVHPKVTATNLGWKFQGNLVSIDATTTSAVVLNVAGTITPGCKKVRLRNGNTNVTFNGTFKGSYQFL